MKINQIQPNTSKLNNKDISYKGLDGRTIISTLANPDSLMTTVSLETCVTGGRGINAYKRGGIDEFRERFLDDVVSAVVWMKGVDAFNKLGNKFGKKFLHLETTDFDIGKDALRTPFKNLSAKLTEEHGEDAAKTMIKKLERFKFTKIIAASLLSTSVIGFIMPRINQKITEKMMHKKQLENTTFNKAENNKQNKFDFSQNNTFEEFDKRIKADKSVSFKGFSEISHILENNTICKMLTNDAGIITGRTTSARNRDEGLEYLFRDLSSIFFYFASTPLIYKGLQKLTNSVGLTNIDPNSAKLIHDNLIKQLQTADGTSISMNSKDFSEKTLGYLDDNAKDIIKKLNFQSDVISLTDFEKEVSDSKILTKAAEMSELQPKQERKRAVLTRQQVEDVFKNGSITQPKFMKKIYEGRFGQDIYDEFRYISMNKITNFRNNIDKYVQSVIDIANKENNGVVDTQLLEKINKNSFIKAGGFRIFAMAVSALCLGFVIPKLQYALTEYRTGSKQAPGFREFEGANKK